MAAGSLAELSAHRRRAARQRRLEGRAQAYEQSREISSQLTAQDPSNVHAQRDVSNSLIWIGDVRLARGDRASALDAYEQSRTIIEALVARDPNNAEWQRDLIVSNVKLGEVAERAGRSAAARGHYQAALGIAVVLRDAGRMAPVDAWMVEDLKARLERVSTEAAR